MSVKQKITKCEFIDNIKNSTNCKCNFFVARKKNSKICKCGHPVFWHSGDEFLTKHLVNKNKILPILSHYTNYIDTLHKNISILIEKYNNRQSLDNNDWLCIICKNAKRETLYLPCRHLQFCKNCSLEWIKDHKKCPICRTKIEGILDVKL